MSLETSDRSGGHEDAPTRIWREVDPFNTFLLAAMDPRTRDCGSPREALQDENLKTAPDFLILNYVKPSDVF